MCISNIKFLKFYEENKEALKDFAILFGNGLPRSCPQIHDHKKINECFTISSPEYKAIWEEINLRVNLYIIKYKKNQICPEKLLNYVRLIYGILVFRNYQEKQQFLTRSEIRRPTNFLNQFKSIYTLNYDLFSYVCRFQQSQEPLSKDGFSNKPLKIEEIKKRLEESNQVLKPFYYLHGAFHIFQKNDQKYEKICSEGDIEKFSEIVISKYNEIDIKLDEYQENDASLDSLPNPILVFSGRTTYKNAAVSDDGYLKYCIDQLTKEKKIFTFGCSFKLDSHILDAIFKGQEDKEIYFGCYDKTDIGTLSSYISEKGINPTKVIFIDISQDNKTDVNHMGTSKNP